MTKNRDVHGIALEILNRLTNGVVMGADDLMGIGDCLNLLEELEGRPDLPEEWSETIQEVKKRFDRIILEESPDVDQDWRAIQEMLSDLAGDGQSQDRGPDVGGSTGGNASEAPGGAPAESEATSAVSEILENPAPEAGSEELEVQDPELLRDFVEEAKEHLASIEINMISLEADPDDKEAVNAVFRPFHSIKGVAGFLNLKGVHELTHEVENLLDEARSGHIKITDALIDLVLNAVDILKVLLGELEDASSGREGAGISTHLVRGFMERVRRFRPDEEGEALWEAPRIGKILVDQGVIEPERLEEVAEKSRRGNRRIGEELVSEGLVAPQDLGRALRQQRHLKEGAASVRVDTMKLDSLVDMVGELVIAQSMVLQNPEVQRIKDQKFQKDAVQLRRITAELQRISMSLRMVPIKSTFQKMIRLVRDLSRKSGKEVTLVMRGEETEIDRNMVEEIYEPLVHMIRNSLDHGIEMPQDRIKAGKEPTGTISLSAEQKGGNIIIELQDDGRGLDVEKIRSRAVERGLISPEDVLEDKDIYELIFHAGFSTKDEVTDVSGRGVGMDVVRKSVEGLRGKLEVSSRPGRGTLFVLKLPLTMAIIDGMVIRVGEERYVVPTVALKESLRPARENYLTVQGRGEMIMVRDRLMSLIRLHELLDVEPQHRHPWDALVLVVTEDMRSYCLLADEIIGRQEVVIKSLGDSLRNVKGISGGAILGDGKVALIIDVKGLLSSYEEGARDVAEPHRRVA